MILSDVERGRGFCWSRFLACVPCLEQARALIDVVLKIQF